MKNAHCQKTQKSFNANLCLHSVFKIKQKEFHFYHYLHSLQVLPISVQKCVSLLQWVTIDKSSSTGEAK
jgi:hypothetical protein